MGINSLFHKIDGKALNLAKPHSISVNLLQMFWIALSMRSTGIEVYPRLSTTHSSCETCFLPQAFEKILFSSDYSCVQLWWVWGFCFPDSSIAICSVRADCVGVNVSHLPLFKKCELRAESRALKTFLLSSKETRPNRPGNCYRALTATGCLTLQSWQKICNFSTNHPTVNSCGNLISELTVCAGASVGDEIDWIPCVCKVGGCPDALHLWRDILFVHLGLTTYDVFAFSDLSANCSGPFV